MRLPAWRANRRKQTPWTRIGTFFNPLAQRRQGHGKHIQAIVGYPPGTFRGDTHVREVAVGGSHDSHVDAHPSRCLRRARARAPAARAEGPACVSSGGRHSRRGTNVPPCASSKRPLPPALRPREGAPLVARRARSRGTPEERPRSSLATNGLAASRRRRVEGPRHQLFSGSGLARDHDGRVAAGDFGDARQRRRSSAGDAPTISSNIDAVDFLPKRHVLL